MLGSYEKPVTGMTVAERWYEVGRRCERGELITGAMVDVFGYGWTDDPDCVAVSKTLETITESAERTNYRAMVAYFLALEAEDAATQDAEPYPPTADVVAEEEPIQVTEAIAPQTSAYSVTYKLDFPERRTTWNTKLADGLRKWAHWLEERF